MSNDIRDTIQYRDAIIRELMYEYMKTNSRDGLSLLAIQSICVPNRKADYEHIMEDVYKLIECGDVVVTDDGRYALHDELYGDEDIEGY